MKRFLIVAAGLMLLWFTLAIAAEKTPPTAPRPPRVPEMNTAGKITEISDKVLKIERTLKGKTEIMSFVMEKPLTNIAVGDQIKVSYLEKDGRNVLIRVAPAKMTAVQKPKKEQPKKEQPKTVKPVDPESAPVKK